MSIIQYICSYIFNNFQIFSCHDAMNEIQYNVIHQLFSLFDCSSFAKLHQKLIAAHLNLCLYYVLFMYVSIYHFFLRGAQVEQVYDFTVIFYPRMI